MATRIATDRQGNVQLVNLDIATRSVGRWATVGDGPQHEPDTCYFCPIGGRGQSVGYVEAGDTRYGVCEKHRKSISPDGASSVFTRYRKKQ